MCKPRIEQLVKNNPLGLGFGAVVTAHRTCSVVYQGDDKVLVYDERPFTGKAIGLVKKALGKYQHGRTMRFFDDEYAEPRLIVSKYVWLYVLKAEFDGPQYLAAPEDIADV